MGFRVSTYHATEINIRVQARKVLLVAAVK